METLSLSKQAERILSDNDKGGYTIPSQLLYPYPWNWDSAFCALGWQQISLERASREVECLLKGQWKNGMIPHILFHRDASSYFPGPDYWCAGESVPSSGYSQPPVLAMAVRAMLRKHRSPAFAERVREWFPRLVAYHRWFWRERNPEGKGLVCVLHPWESGRDNLPDWDLGLEEVDTGAVKDFRRSDTDIVDSSLRPLNRDYQRYLALVEIGKQRGWDSEKMIRDQPFVMYDVLMTAVLIRANRELLEIGEMIGETGSAGEITGWIETAATNFGDLWNEEKQAFCSYDLKKKAFAGHASSATVAALLTETVKGERLKTTLETFDRWCAKVNYALPCMDPDDPAFEEKRYWKGPVWIMLNYLIREGLLLYGETRRAERILADSEKLIAKSGFWEYYSPYTGEGLGGKEFSWTAAVYLQLTAA